MDHDDNLLQILRTLDLTKVLVSARLGSEGALHTITGAREKRAAAEAAKIRHIGFAEKQKDDQGNDVQGEGLFNASSLAGLAVSAEQALRAYGSRLPMPAALRGESYAAGSMVGRAWLKRHIKTFINDNASGYIVLQAPPLWGKSLFALEWVRQSQHHHLRTDPDDVLLPPLTGWVFARRGEEQTNFDACLNGLQAQARLNANIPRTPNQHEKQSADAVRDDFWAFLTALSTSSPDVGRKFVLLFDGCDESFGSASTVPEVFKKALPANVYVVLCTRAGSHINWNGVKPGVVIDLSQEVTDWHAQCQHDVDEYFNLLATRDPDPELAALLASSDTRAALGQAVGGHMYIAKHLTADAARLKQRLIRRQREGANTLSAHSVMVEVVVDTLSRASQSVSAHRGARSVLRHAGGKDDRLRTWAKKLQTAKGTNAAAVALANKLARIAWALLAHGRSFSLEWRAVNGPRAAA